MAKLFELPSGNLAIENGHVESFRLSFPIENGDVP